MIYITDNSTAKKIIADLESEKVLYLDTECQGLNEFKDKVLLIQIGTAKEQYLFDARKVDISLFKPLLESTDVLKVGQNCLPISAKALTKDGWKGYDEISTFDYVLGYKDGLLEWCKVQKVISPRKMEILEFGNDRRAFKSSLDHRWLSQRYDTYRSRYKDLKFTSTEDILKQNDHRIIMSAPLKDYEGVDLTDNEIKIIAWLITDGYISFSKKTPRDGKTSVYNARICQSKGSIQEEVLELVKDIMTGIAVILAKNSKQRDCYVYRLKNSIIKELWDKAGLYDISLEQLVLKMSSRQRKLFLEVIFKADGCKTLKHNLTIIAQIKGGKYNAVIMLAAFLEGYFPRQLKDIITFCRPQISSQHLKIKGVTDEYAWCIETELGTWVAKDGDQIFLTGNCKYDLKMIYKNHDIILKRLYDTMLAELILTAGLPDIKVSLEAVAKKYLDIDMDKSITKSFIGMTDQDFTEEQLKYSALDVEVLPTIYQAQSKLLKQHGLIQVAKLEFSIIEPVAMMEMAGIKVDKEKWQIALRQIKGELMGLKGELLEVLPQPELTPPPPLKLKKDGTPFSRPPKWKLNFLNLDSPIQIAETLISLGIDLDKYAAMTRKGKTQEITLTKAVNDIKLSKKNRELLELLLQYRMRRQLTKNFGDNLLASVSDDGRLRTDFHQLGTKSGRFSSGNGHCNLQQMPKRSEQGAYLRTCFVARNGYKIASLDFSQIEIRLLAEFSQDKKMVAALNSGADLHTATAELMFSVDMSNLEKTNKDKFKRLRTFAKTLNFAIFYGMSDSSLSIRLNISLKEAQDLMGRYKATYNQAVAWLDVMGNKCLREYKSFTGLGRIRWFTALISDVEKETRSHESFIKRAGRNGVIQGTCGDILKQAIHDIYYNVKNVFAVNTIHDELVYEVPELDADKYAEQIKYYMVESAKKFIKSVPVEVEISLGEGWG